MATRERLWERQEQSERPEQQVFSGKNADQLGTTTEQLGYVTLVHGPTVHIDAIAWLLDAEVRGIDVQRHGADLLFAGAVDRVTADDRRELHRLGPDIARLVAYVDSCAHSGRRIH